MKKKIEQGQPMREKGWISTEDRITEILSGLIMTLTFTCTFSITKSDKTSVDDMLFGALGSNIAWGFIDAIMYLLSTKTDEVRGLNILNFVRKSKKTGEACGFITDSLPPVIANVLQPEEVEKIRERIMQLPASTISKKQRLEDYKKAGVIFLIVFLSTFPVAIPFIFISDLHTALRTSNIVATLMMFFCGCALGKYVGRNRFVMGLIISLIGTVLVLVTIALGG